MEKQHSQILSEMKDLQSIIYLDIEKHCQQRFNQLVKKFESLESRIIKVERKLNS